MIALGAIVTDSKRLRWRAAELMCYVTIWVSVYIYMGALFLAPDDTHSTAVKYLGNQWWGRGILLAPAQLVVAVTSVGLCLEFLLGGRQLGVQGSRGSLQSTPCTSSTAQYQGIL